MLLQTKKTDTTYTLIMNCMEIRALLDALGNMAGPDYASDEARVAGDAMYDVIVNEMEG